MFQRLYILENLDQVGYDHYVLYLVTRTSEVRLELVIGSFICKDCNTSTIILRGDSVETARAGDTCTLVGTMNVIPDVSKMSIGNNTQIIKGDDFGGVGGLKDLGVREMNYRVCFFSQSVRSNVSKISSINRKESGDNSGGHSHSIGIIDEDLEPESKSRSIFITRGWNTNSHVLAKQANYNPVEINVSEDRSGEAFESKLLSAIEMKSLFNDNKPNCLIIDEIDGISGRDNGPIELLIKLIDNSLKLGNHKKSTTNPATKKSGKDTESDDESGDEADDEDNGSGANNDEKSTKTKGKKGKKKGFTTRLLRPIICICNDQYVPSLRKLRQKAMIKVICSNEGLTATDATLNALIDMTGSDISACINSLQFVKSKTTILVEIWNNIFKSSSISSNNNKLSKYSNTISSSSSSIDSIVGNDYLNQLDFQIGACNQVDKLIDGVYENYLTNMSSDYTMQKTMDCLDWMVFGDQMLNVHADKKYRSLVPLAIHQRCTTYSPKIQLPHSDYDNFIKKKSNSNIKDSFYSNLQATICSYLTKKCFVIENICLGYYFF
ncbi:hypothetical protein ACTFIZ_003146 [Dictyostelium cf. discoideum]